MCTKKTQNKTNNKQTNTLKPDQAKLSQTKPKRTEQSKISRREVLHSGQFSDTLYQESLLWKGAGEAFLAAKFLVNTETKECI